MENLPVVAPIIHLNGDRTEVLITRLSDAYDAVQSALEVLRATAPNGRNYYPQPGLLEQALAQHAARQAALCALLDGLEAEITAIEAQG